MSAKTAPAVLALLCWLGPHAAHAAPDVLVVVHADHPEATIARTVLAQIFLGKQPQWPSGEEALPADQVPSAEVREVFSQAVHGRSAESIGTFWARMIFSGRGGTPPPELTSDREVLEYVRVRPGAVGYVTAAAALGDGVRVLEVVDDVSGEPLFADVPAPAADDGGGSTAAEEAQRHGDVRLSSAGRCGRLGDGERMVLENLNRYDPVRVTVETATWVQGRFRSASQQSRSLAPLESEELGCTRLSESVENRFSLAGVSDAAAHHDPDVAEGTARGAVEIVAAGTCGQGRAGRVMQVINRHPWQTVSVEIRHIDRVGGVHQRTYTRSFSIVPGDEKRLGCSADGRLTREFQVAEARYR